MGKRKILIVDDDELSRGFLRDVMKAAGHDTIEVEDGIEALDLLKSAKPDLIILDLQMPLRSGYSIMAEIRRVYGNLPVIIVTGYADVETAVDCVKGGAIDFIAKPADIERLVHSVQKALSGNS